jgi:hypothetical protein
VRDLALRSADTLVVEGDHPPAGGELVDERGVPVVEVAPEVLEEEHGTPVASGVTIGDAESVSGLCPQVGQFGVGSHVLLASFR